MTIKRNLHRALRLLSAALSLLLSLITLASCSRAPESSHPISPAAHLLASRTNMALWAKKGDSIRFCAADFARALNISEENIESVTVTSLPPASDGELRVGSMLLTGEQTLSAASLSLMSYSQSSEVSVSQFNFRVNDLPYEMCCKLYILESENYAPTLSLTPSASLEVSTYENVSFFGELTPYDADGDEVFIEVITYPEKGIVEFGEGGDASYCYIPFDGAVGKDSFICVARDRYGNYSPSCKVSIDISKTESSARFVDLIDSPYHNAALRMNEKGVMSGTQVGSSLYFYPELEVCRAEFVVMAMSALGMREVNPASSTVFADDADIPNEMRPYVAAAYDLGYVKGSVVDGKLCFLPNADITRAEAAVILANMAPLPSPALKPVFGDTDDIPTWASASLSSLFALGVFSESESGIEPLEPLTRGDAALILSRFSALKLGS